MKRYAMDRADSRRNFKSNAGHHPKNGMHTIMRGGYRL